MVSALISNVRTLLLAVIAALMSACAQVEASRPAVRVDMRNVDLHVAPDVTLHVRSLSGEFVGMDGHFPYLDNRASYTVAVESGEIAVDLQSLNALMTRALGGDHSNVEKLKVSIADDGTLQQSGVIDKGVNVPFSSKSTVSVTADGRIRIATQSMKGFGVPMQPVLSLFRMKMDDLLKVKPGRGVVVDGNDVIIDPGALLPSPAIHGRLSSVRVEANALVQVFGDGRARPSASRSLAPNHIYWRGGQLAFGKLTMSDTDLELVDLDSEDPFDFSVDDWDAQLVAGYSKTLQNKGLRAFVPDYNDLRKSPAAKAAGR